MEGNMDIQQKKPLTPIRNPDGSLKDKEAWREENSSNLTGLDVDQKFAETSGHNMVPMDEIDTEDLKAIQEANKENM